LKGLTVTRIGGNYELIANLGNPQHPDAQPANEWPAHTIFRTGLTFRAISNLTAHVPNEFGAIESITVVLNFDLKEQRMVRTNPYLSGVCIPSV